MPNIEIHGLSKLRTGEMRDKVFSLFRDSNYIDEIVVTIFSNEVMDNNGHDQPFIRLFISHQLHTEEILEKLKTLGMDIEHLKLEAFIPKRE